MSSEKDLRIWDVEKKSTLTGNEKFPIDSGNNTAETTDLNDLSEFVADTATIQEVDALFD